MASILCAVFGLLLLAAAVHGQAPTVTITLTDPETHSGRYIKAIRDNDIVMDCYVENLPPSTTVRWQRTYQLVNGTRTIIALSQDMALEDNIHYSIERPTQFTWRLRIRAAQVTDDGIYQCFVLTTLNSRAQDEREISIVFAPYFDLQQTSSDTAIDSGENIELTCNATARPRPTIQWTRLGGKLLPIGQERKMGSILAITNIKAEDRGVYRCEAVNSIATIHTDINVEVRFTPIVTAHPETVYQAVGYRIEMQCFAESNPAPMAEQSYWTFASRPLTSSSEEYEERFLVGAFGRVTYELIIFNVQPSSYGEYTCTLANDKGAGDLGYGSKTVTLVQTDVPQASIKLGRVIAAATASRVSVILLLASAVLGLFISRTVSF